MTPNRAAHLGIPGKITGLHFQKVLNAQVFHPFKTQMLTGRRLWICASDTTLLMYQVALVCGVNSRQWQGNLLTMCKISIPPVPYVKFLPM